MSSGNVYTSKGLIALQKKTIKSVLWSFTSRISTRALDFIKIIIVARLLVPEDFGLLGIALLTTAVFEVFSQTGFKESIIQNKNDVDSYLNTAWTTLVIRGFVIYGIIFLISPFVAGFFGEPRAELILQVIGINLILEGFQNIAIVFLSKELEFKKKFLLDLGKTLPSFILTVSLAFILRNVWALVFGTLIGGVGLLFISYLIHPYKPQFEFKRDKASEMFTFGKWILGSSIISFLLTQGDDIFVGRFLGAVSLGFYQLAYQISNISATEITHTISNVLFPTYSKLQDNLSNLRHNYLKTLQITALVSFPIAGLIFSLTPDFTMIFLGIKWTNIIPAMQILAFYGLNRSIGATTGPLFNGLGKPKIVAKLQFVQLILLAIMIYPLSERYGFVGTSIAITIASISLRPITTIVLCRLIKLRCVDYIKSIFPQFLSMIIMIGNIYLIKIIIKDINIINFVIIGLIGIASYTLPAVLIGKIFGYNFIGIIKSIFLCLKIKSSEN